MSTPGLRILLRVLRLYEIGLQWLDTFLPESRQLVETPEVYSRGVLLYQGVPHGRVVSATLFHIYINNVIKDRSAGLKVSLRVYDLVLQQTHVYNPA